MTEQRGQVPGVQQWTVSNICDNQPDCISNNNTRGEGDTPSEIRRKREGHLRSGVKFSGDIRLSSAKGIQAGL